MSRKIDLTGQRFGRLTVTAAAPARVTPNGSRKSYWICECNCGRSAEVESRNLRTGHIQSCGCLASEVRRELVLDLAKQCRGVPRQQVVTYGAAHQRIRVRLGSARKHLCVECGGQAREWSYDGGDPNELTELIKGYWLAYSLDAACYSPRCIKCHRRLDRAKRSILKTVGA